MATSAPSPTGSAPCSRGSSPTRAASDAECGGARGRGRTPGSAARLSPGGLAYALAQALAACTFEPVVRPVELVRVDPAAQRIERTLPNEEAAVLTLTRDADGATRYRIVRWYTRTGCTLPDDTARVYAPLAAPLGTRDGALALPLARQQGSTHTLWLSDRRCRLSGPLGELDPEHLRVFTSAVDQRSLLAFQDPAARLFLFDPEVGAEPRPVAEQVRSFELRVATSDPVRDLLWIREGGALVAREVDGRAHVRLGSDVTAYALYDSLAPRVAYVDGGDLYEALPPSYVPLLRAEHACAPRYDREALWLHVPCDDRQLLRVPLSTGSPETFPRGVFDAVALAGLEVLWAVDEHGDTAAYVSGPGVRRQRLASLPKREGLVALDDTRLLGQDASGDLVLWSLSNARVDTLLAAVDEITPHTDALGQTTWLVHHGSDARGLGQLSTVALSSLSVQAIAEDVPMASEQGYALVRSDLLSRLPGGAPLVVYRERARPLRSDPARHAGTLRAALLGTGTSTLLAEDVTSFAAITEPFPGFLVSIEEGPRTGLWLAAL